MIKSIVTSSFVAASAIFVGQINPYWVDTFTFHGDNVKFEDQFILTNPKYVEFTGCIKPNGTLQFKSIPKLRQHLQTVWDYSGAVKLTVGKCPDGVTSVFPEGAYKAGTPKVFGYLFEDGSYKMISHPNEQAYFQSVYKSGKPVTYILGQQPKKK